MYEPGTIYDLDVFVRLPDAGSSIVLLAPVYEWLDARGFKPDAEHVLVHGVPVQLIPAYNELVEEAISDARLHDYDDVPVRVTPPEHLIALAFQAGGGRRRERAFQLLETTDVNRTRLEAILRRHRIEMP